VVVSTKNHSPYGITCIRCNEGLIAPNWSKYVSERHIRHFWSCESCGHQFETSDDLGINAFTKTRQKVPPLSLACRVNDFQRCQAAANMGAFLIVPAMTSGRKGSSSVRNSRSSQPHRARLSAPDPL